MLGGKLFARLFTRVTAMSCALFVQTKRKTVASGVSTLVLGSPMVYGMSIRQAILIQKSASGRQPFSWNRRKANLVYQDVCNKGLTFYMLATSWY